MVELESEGEVTRGEVAAFLRAFADELDDGVDDRHPEGDGRRVEGLEADLQEGDPAERHDDLEAPHEDGAEPRHEERREEEAEARREAHRDAAEHGVTAADEGGAAPRRITFIVGGDSATVTVPDTVEFDVEVESRSPMLSSEVSQEIELELSWSIEDSDELDDPSIIVE